MPVSRVVRAPDSSSSLNYSQCTSQKLLNLAFAILHFVLAPTGLEPVAAALVAGNLFGIVLPYLG